MENDQGELVPQTRCGEYHLKLLRLNRPSRVARRCERNEFMAQLAGAFALIQRLEKEPETSLIREVIAHLNHQTESLQAELAVAIPFIPAQTESP